MIFIIKIKERLLIRWGELSLFLLDNKKSPCNSLNCKGFSALLVEPKGQKSNFFDWDLGGVVKMIGDLFKW